MAATTSYYCEATEPCPGEGWSIRRPPVSNAWPDSHFIPRGHRPVLPPGLPPPPGFACPVEGSTAYPAPPLPTWGSREGLYDGGSWNRQQQEGAPNYPMTHPSGRIYEERVWQEHQRNYCPLDLQCGAPASITLNTERMREGTVRNRRVPHVGTSYVAPNPQDRTNHARNQRRFQNGDLSFSAPASHDRIPRRRTDRRNENGVRADSNHRDERRGQNCRRQNGAPTFPCTSDSTCEGRSRQPRHRNVRAANCEVEAPCARGYGGVMYHTTHAYIGDRDPPGDYASGPCPTAVPLDPHFAPAMCAVRRSPRPPCDQYMQRLPPPYTDFRAAAALTAAAFALNGSAYLCPAAQPFVRSPVRNGVAQPPNRAVESPPVLKPPKGVPVVIREEDGTICRCIRADRWTGVGCLQGKRTPRAGDLAVVACLSERDEGRLEVQIQELVRGLTPDEAWHNLRLLFLGKLRKTLASSDRADIDIFMFGSTVSGLATADSDADVYVRTGRGAITVHNIADLLQRGGMEQVVVIDAAKVQIVKFHDTEFRIKCDINVDGKLALVNTRLVKSYVAIDWRVRAFIITVKHWAKRRGLNAAAEKTLSSYAWSCLCINHLQTRNPPILPSLHVLAQNRRTSTGSSHCTNSSIVPTDPERRFRSPSPVSTASELDEEEEREAEDFVSDLSELDVSGFGAKNTESVAALLCSFFKTMAYDFDYHNTVVSVRQGTQIPKTEKGWNVGGCNVGRGRPYRVLAIEDPINIRRNLANSADETAVAGLRCEFRRAWKVLCQTGSLAEVCERWQRQSGESQRQEHATWSPRFHQEEVLADVEDFRRTQPAPRSISSLSDGSTCSSGIDSRRSSICEESTPPTSAACSSPTTCHVPDKGVAEEEVNLPLPGTSAIEPAPPPVEIANSMAAESQTAVVGEARVSPPAGYVAGTVAETLPSGFMAEERAEHLDRSHEEGETTTPPLVTLPPAGTPSDCGTSESSTERRGPSSQTPSPSQAYEQEWPTLAEAGTRPQRNRRCQRMVSSSPRKPAPSKVVNSASDGAAKPQSTTTVAASGGKREDNAPKKALMGIGRGMPFPQMKAPRSSPPASSSRMSRPPNAHPPAPAATTPETAAKPERQSPTRRTSRPAWAKVPLSTPTPPAAAAGRNEDEWPTLAASRGGGRKKYNS